MKSVRIDDRKQNTGQYVIEKDDIKLLHAEVNTLILIIITKK